MNPRQFIALAIAVVVFGGGLGASFAGGVAVGRNQAESTAAASPMQPIIAPGAAQTGPSAPQDTAAGVQEAVGRIEQRLQTGGEPTPEDLELLRRQLGQLGPGGFTGADGAGPQSAQGLTGTIESVEGDLVSITTAQGTVQARIGDDTTIQRLVTVDAAGLESGLQVTVAGQRAPDGALEADTIFVIPEDGFGSLFGGGGFAGRSGFGAGRFTAPSDNALASESQSNP